MFHVAAANMFGLLVFWVGWRASGSPFTPPHLPQPAAQGKPNPFTFHTKCERFLGPVAGRRELRYSPRRGRNTSAKKSLGTMTSPTTTADLAWRTAASCVHPLPMSCSWPSGPRLGFGHVVQADLTTFAGGFLPMDAWNDPAELTPNERLRQIAAMLAAGLLRLRRCLDSGAFSAGEADSIPNYQQESRPEGLDLSRKTRLSVPVG